MIASLFGGLGLKLLMGAAIVGAGLFIVHQIQQVGALKAVNAQLEQVNQHNQQVVNELQARRQAERRLLTMERDEAMTRERATSKQLEAIANAPPSKDGPVAAVLAGAIAGLPEQATGDTVRDGEAGSPTSLTDVPGSAD